MKLHHDSPGVPKPGRKAASLPLPDDEPGTRRSRMAYKIPSEEGLKLELVPDPLLAPLPPNAATHAAPAFKAFEATPATADTIDYIGKAIKELQQGRIDQRLWARAIVEAGGDESFARPNYLRARATALRALARDRQAGKAERQALTPTSSRAPSVEPPSRREAASDHVHPDASRNANVKALLRSPITILGALTSLIVAITLVIAWRPADTTVEPIVASRPVSLAGSSRSLPANNDAATRAAVPGAGQDFMKVLQASEDAGNWNDVVAQAAAWTQKEPENAWAWSELSLGYFNVQRLDDAHAAARKAVELAPKNALMWRNLGKLSMDRNAAIEALLAFEEATRWNARDGYSFVQAGILHARLDQLQEAKLAFDKALALNPADVSARCGTAYVVQRQAQGIASQPKPANGACRDLFDRASTTADPGGLPR